MVVCPVGRERATGAPIGRPIADACHRSSMRRFEEESLP